MSKRASSSPLWNQLRVGDWIRIVAIPPLFLQKGYCFPRETRELYERLIRLRRAVKVAEIDEWRNPWIMYRPRGEKQIHCLAIGEHDLFVRVKPRKR